MDIDLLSKMVKELILDDDKVVLPGLGCFVAEIVPAYFSDKGYTINPPYRKLYFRARPDEGGSLIDFYARSNGVSHEVAEKIIKDFVSELKAVLHAKKVVVFPGLGRLRATKENNIFFIANEDLDIYPEGFGLEPVSLKTHKETAEDVSAAVADLKSMLSTEQEPVAEPVQEPLPEPEPIPEPDPLPEPDSEIEILVEPMPDSELETVPEAETMAESVPESETVPEPEIVPEPESIPVVTPAVEAAVEKKGGVKWGKVLLIVLAVLALLVIAYMLVGRLCPEWIDRFLYTPEELEIINR